MAFLAAQQHGVVARTQLLDLGLTRNKVQKRADAGQLHRIHRGVYAVGHRKLTLKGVWMSAVLACGPEALLSHRAALALWDLRRSESGVIDVTVPGRSGKPGPRGVRVHTTLKLHADDVAHVDGISVTSLAWTVVDYAAIARRQQLRSILETLERRGDYIGRELDELLQRTPNRKGVKALRITIAAGAPSHLVLAQPRPVLLGAPAVDAPHGQRHGGHQHSEPGKPAEGGAHDSNQRHQPAPDCRPHERPPRKIPLAVRSRLLGLVVGRLPTAISNQANDEHFTYAR